MAVKLKVSKDELQKRLNERFGTNQAPSKDGSKLLPKEKKASDLVTKKLQQSNVSQSKPNGSVQKKAKAKLTTPKYDAITPKQKVASATERTAKTTGWVDPRNPNGRKRSLPKTKGNDESAEVNWSQIARDAYQERGKKQTANVKQSIEAAMAEKKNAAQRAVDTATERGKNQTNRVIQQRQYDEIKAKKAQQTAEARAKTASNIEKEKKAARVRKTKEKQASRAINAAQTKGEALTQKTKAKQAVNAATERGMKQTANVKSQQVAKPSITESGTLTKVKSKSKKTSSAKPTKQSFTKSKKNVSMDNKGTKQTLKKAFNANQVMKERRAKAMANRDKSKNPNNINLRGITKKGKKR